MVFECGICYRKTSENSKIILECIHIFCHECIGKWIRENPTCPVCRKLISEQLQRQYNPLSSNYMITFHQQQPPHTSLTAEELEERGERGEFYRRFASPPFEVYDWGKSKQKTT